MGGMPAVRTVSSAWKESGAKGFDEGIRGVLTQGGGATLGTMLSLGGGAARRSREGVGVRAPYPDRAIRCSAGAGGNGYGNPG